MSPHPEKSPNFSVLVQEDGDLQSFLFQKLSDSFTGFFSVDAEKNKIPGAILGVYFIKRRTLLPAIKSPGGPKIEKDGLSTIIPYVDRLSLQVLQGKFGNWHGLGISMENTLPGEASCPP